MKEEQERDFLKRLRATFKVEADEHLQAMSALLLQMETDNGADGASPALLETLFREAHSLKGAARAVNLNGIETVCQALESVLAELKERQAAPPSGFFDVLYRTLDAMRQLLDIADAQEEGAQMALPAADAAHALESLRQELRERKDAGAAASDVPSAPPAPAPMAVPAGTAKDVGSGGDTVRIATEKLDALMVQAEEMLSFKFGATHFALELREMRGELESWRRACEKTAREARAARRVADAATSMARGRRAPPVGRWLEAAEREASFAKGLVARFNQIESAAQRERRTLSGLVDNLLEDMKKALMQPFSSLLEMFPRLVRDLAQHSGKKADLSIDGATLEIDRRILEQMKDPLIHLLRNAVDHGIETPELRMRKGKPARGRIRISIVPREGNRVQLSIEDDGSGIDPEQVKETALELGIISAEVARGLNERDALALIFTSGLSTSATLTDLSGRGLGLAIVREKVENLGGCITVERSAAGGTHFCMLLPVSLATFHGLLIKIGERQFVLPSRNVERVARMAAAGVKTVGNRDTVEFDGRAVALVHLGAVLDIAHESIVGTPAAQLPVLLLAESDERIAFAVDEVIGDQEVLAKGLGPQLLRVPNIAGATVLGPGLAVPILNVADLLKSAQRSAVPASPQRRPAAPPKARRSVLVAEDSITSRSLLQHVLQSAGYDVTTAVDGAEALETLHRGRFDLVVSDVEMPRMDGFVLTARIRADARTAELPVVLATSLESRDQKERGVEAGANAYIVKSAFDRDKLLDVIRSLI